MNLSAFKVRTQGERRHHRNSAQEKQDISRVHLGKCPVEIDLIVSPLKLTDHPKSAAHGEQHPEDISPPVGRAGVQEQSSIGEERHDALHDVAESVERIRAAL